MVGSFRNVCIYRLPLNKSIVFPPSACPGCGSPIAWRDNTLCWGTCCWEGSAVPAGDPFAEVPAVELLNALLTLSLFYRFNFSITFAALFLLCSALVVITFIDLEHQIIPDCISIPGIVIGFAASFS